MEVSTITLLFKGARADDGRAFLTILSRGYAVTPVGTVEELNNKPADLIIVYGRDDKLDVPIELRHKTIFISTKRGMKEKGFLETHMATDTSFNAIYQRILNNKW